MALSTLPQTVAARTHSNQKMSQDARLRARVACMNIGRCIYCDLRVCGSRLESDGTLPAASSNRDPRTQSFRKTAGAAPRQDAHALHLAHLVSAAQGGTARPGNIGPSHRACNLAAGDIDSTPFVIMENVPTGWPTIGQARDAGDPRDLAPIPTDEAPTEDAMRAARARRGLPF